MSENTKSAGSLTVTDLAITPVWEFTNGEGVDELLVRPVCKLPVPSLTGKIIGTRVGLSNGSYRWALIGNIDATNPRMTEHFLTLSLERKGRWFGLARYHDHDFADRGPEALSGFLGLQVDDVFPIAFDVRAYALGHAESLEGSIRKEPRERLSRAEIIAMAVS